MAKKRIILVTGVAGFIGSNFVREYVDRFPKDTVIGIDDFSTGRRSALDKRILFYEGDVADLSFVNRIFKKHKPQYVVHFAARPRVSYSVEHPTETTISNIVGTVSILEASRDYKVKRVVYSSSSALYGGAKRLPTKEHENPPNPISPYALQKYTNEPFCQIFSDLFGLDTVCLRYFNVFGPGQFGDSAYSTVVSAWLESLYFPKKKKGFIEGNGKQSRDFCYVDNVVQANMKALFSPKKFNGEAFNIAHGERTTLLEVKKLIEKYTGKKLKLEKRPARLGDVRHTHANIDKARKLFNYKPQYNFEQGLKHTIAWYASRKS
jgi:nucleoside-diphosphate-sugar epimerase